MTADVVLGLARAHADAAVRAPQGATVPVSEVFGPVWQGEGPYAGRVCWFLRLGLCNLGCEWCDTPFTWDHTRYDVAAECPPRTAAWLTERLAAIPAGAILVLSGGEPLMHQGNAALQAALSTPHMNQVAVHVETNGTIAPNRWALDRVAHFTVSPKVNPQGDPEKKRIKPRALAAFADLARDGRAAFKVVCATPQDVEAAARFYDDHDVPAAARWVMPEGVTADAVMDHARAIADTATRHGLNLSLRQHTLMYGTERAR